VIPRKGEYGFDAPYVPISMVVGALPLLAGAVFRGLHGAPTAALTMGLSGAFLLASAGSYLYTTRAGKLRAWDELLDELHLTGDERILDLGCGRGAVLLLAAQRLPAGRAVGVDLWSAVDQSGNALETTRRNAALEGVADRVDLHTGDMRELPFPDGSFDGVVSSLAIHNIPDVEGRASAVREAARVLRPGGRVLLADFRFTDAYADTLREAGLADVARRALGARFWYGGPWAATHVVTARKPA
jgi:SAM-dependent methyltransferase